MGSSYGKGRREASLAEARIAPPLVDVYLTVAVRTSAVPDLATSGCRRVRLPRWSTAGGRSTDPSRRWVSQTAASGRVTLAA